MRHPLLSILGFSLLLQSPLFAKSNPVAKPAPTLPTAISLAEKNQTLGKTFLEENANKPNTQTLPSGLQYKINQEGAGSSPGPTDFVTVHYRGVLLDGTEFDSSYNHNAPATFAVNAVIPGWTEALQLMKPGAKWTLYIPAALAYGPRGAGKLIGPNATLIFDVELISIKPALENSSGGEFLDNEDDG